MKKTLLFFVLIISSCIGETEIEDDATISDIDGNVYDVLKIADEYWTTKNLKVKTLYFRLMIIFTVIILIFLISYFWQTTLLVALVYLLFSLVSLFAYFFKFFRRVS